MCELKLEFESFEIVANIKVGDEIGKMTVLKLTYDELKEILKSNHTPSSRSSFKDKLNEMLNKQI